MATYWLECNASTDTVAWRVNAAPPTGTRLLKCNDYPDDGNTKEVTWNGNAWWASLTIESATDVLSWD